MRYTADALYALLPAVHRARDASNGEPLRALLSVLAAQAGVVAQDIADLYDNWFVETCDEWVVPYIADLLGVRGLHPVSDATFSQRARVANTIGHRRRKGTASMLEQLAVDTTGWPAHVVEFFQLLGTTQHVDHIRSGHVRTPDLRQTAPLELLGTPFDTIAHTADVRHADNGRGRYNVMNVGIFLWRLRALPIVDAPAFAHGGGRFSFHQLGCDAPLFTHAVAASVDAAPVVESAVPAPIRRRALADAPSEYVGAGRSLLVTDAGQPLDVVACNLTDWARRPAPPAGGRRTVAVDPVLGRLSFAAGDEPDPRKVRVTYYQGFSSDLGGGGYERALTGAARYVVAQSHPDLRSVQQALARWTDDGRPDATIEIADSGVYEETLAVHVPAGGALIVRAGQRQRPVLRLAGPLAVTGEGGPLRRGGSLTLDGLLVAGPGIEIRPGALGTLLVRHCTLVPSGTLTVDGQPAAPGTVSLHTTGNAELAVALERTVTGRLDVRSAASLTLTDTIVDGLGGDAVAASTFAARACTIHGSSKVVTLSEASNCLFTQRVTADRRQQGCVRFCYVAPGSIVPRRYHCQPDLALERAEGADRSRVRLAMRPRFTSDRYGDPGYGQLAPATPVEIRAGADDQAEMGAFHHLQQPQREANLRASIDEYLRVGLEAGLFYVT